MLMMILGILDIIVSLALLFPDLIPIVSFYLGVIIFAKACISFLMSFAVGYYADFFGLLDLLAGISLLFHIYIPALFLLIALKGLASLFA